MAAVSVPHNDEIDFHEMGLDDRILKAIAKLRWIKPTPIQEKAVPLALDGKDLLIKARTGSGKTAAVSIPIIQKILQGKQTAKEQSVKALVLAPSKELCRQTYKNFMELSKSCSREIKCIEIAGHTNVDTQRSLLLENPDIVIGTPSKVLAHLSARNLNLKSSLEMVLIDEADLMFSFGYEEDVKKVLGYLPKIYQGFLMSATLSDDVMSLKKLVLHNACILKLQDHASWGTSQLTQFYVKCQEEEKFILLYALFKLFLIRGKTIIFINTVDKGYRLKLYFEQFAIPACLLNSELPINSRNHIVSQFNDGIYNCLIASDELSLEKSRARVRKRKIEGTTLENDDEFVISRGIDFQYVSNIINFDFPLSVDSYIHRVGRTARANNTGTALSFISRREAPLLRAVERFMKADGKPSPLKPYQFRMEEIDGFRYRALDAMRAVTSLAVRNARLKEIKSEIINSEKLKTYFEDNPQDFHLLRHDKMLHSVRVQQHLRHVPNYLIPPSLKHIKLPTSTSGIYRPEALSEATKKFMKKQDDPLHTFNVASSMTKNKNIKRRKKK